MWQYTSRGVIDTIGDDIRFDFNYVYRDYPSIIKRFGYNGYEPQL
jgi:GH25 family lysozyme M1 (1,4-beta-N-acetylmuramidase)